MPTGGAPAAEGTGGWLGADRIRTVALAIVALSVLWRAQLASRGFLAADDYVMITQAAEADLTVGHLLTLYNNHLMPAGRLITWLITEHLGMVYWPYVLLMALGQAILGIAFLRLLRRLLRPSWLLLLPLGALMFSPLTLEATSWWAVGVNMLPMQIAMVLAVSAQVSYVQTGRKRHLLTLALSVLLGLVFFEKAILVVALVFLLTAALYADGGFFRTLWITLRRWWPSWLLLTALSLGFLAAYLINSESSLRRPTSVGEVFTFLTQMLGSTVMPGLVGGPWRWLGAGDGAPVAAPPELGRWVAWTLVVALIVATVRRRRRAGRAWLLLGAYLVLVAGMLAATRLGSTFSGVAGGVPRYVSDVVVVAAICLGVAVVGLARPSRGTRETEPANLDISPAGPEVHPKPADVTTPDRTVAVPSSAPTAPDPVSSTPPAGSTTPVLAESVRTGPPRQVVARLGVIHAEAPVDPEPQPTAAAEPVPSVLTPERVPDGAAGAVDSPGPVASQHPAGGPDPGDATAPSASPRQAVEQPAEPERRPLVADSPPPPGLFGPLPERYREAVHVVLALVLVAVCLGTVWTTSRYSDEWAAKSGRSYVDTVRIEMASAPPDTVFFDGPVPNEVVPNLSWPYNLQSRFFRAFGTRPTFVDEADNLSVLDSLGRIQVATVIGSTIQPGPQEGCGYLVSGGQSVRMPLNEPRQDWHWVVRIGYLSSTTGTATLRLGTGTAEFPIKKGLNQRFFRIIGGGDSVELTVRGTDISFCTNEIAIGNPAPKPE
ncbi:MULTISPECIES: hypothetical protein [unclassified Micromonospora]|uniref:hypothetical protein n=1 Tax=unclassified Micromonospora TaxID=2617518 RepID=UPI0022B60C8C|nr:MULTISPECIES: hypothetical protein [unclassified Micromonospora]MCZ7417974.1 hypothetical protein [Verrucosispora sp. WMMA2121]MCZ7419561.1 hypothetical protein [Verrucosispora sp. WMMA2121]MCZ7419580.1 hypothetical protein [Verrucosispora sp. WMMA2121]WBB93190.1 hypothetical protein O7597_09560 [Verrucosispora sp. WMMC514]